MDTISAFWFRRDLRIDDNAGLYHALSSGKPVLPVFIFDTDITDPLPKDDPRVSFIYDALAKLNNSLAEFGSSILIEKGKPLEVWKKIMGQFQIDAVYANHDYEPYASKRDEEIKNLLESNGIPFHTFKDQVIFEKHEVVKADGKPYTVFTPYKKQWLRRLGEARPETFASFNLTDGFHKARFHFPKRKELDQVESKIKARPFNYEVLPDYDQFRNFPARDRGSYFGTYLRFGLVSIRDLVDLAISSNETYLSELIWREFFMQILFHFPHVTEKSFKPKYDRIEWINDQHAFESWCAGKTGYPMVDAGMRELNETGYMHNRVRMVTASFLCKHLLTDWRWGEAYFAAKLFDFELSSNNGNWQWAAGTGCDAAPYFRVFNPAEQQKKFDSNFEYIKRWVPEFDTDSYPAPIVDHAMARNRAIATYKKSLTE
jgi:deoxyribodipyrimidine photo-lyase